MKYIWLGIKDYCKDCWHDWLRNRLQKVQGEGIYTYDEKTGYTYWVYSWREGSVWHYIQQRRIAKQRKIAKQRNEQ